MSALKRLRKEHQKLHKNPIPNCSATPSDNNILKWNALILGPKDTVYEGGIFKLEFNFSLKYPLEPPLVRFKTKIYHPNIDSSGGICLDILKNEWSPIQNISSILLSICSLLNDPNPEDPLVVHIAQLYKENRKKFEEEANCLTGYLSLTCILKTASSLWL